MIKAMIFDVDGVVFKSDRGIIDSINETLAYFGGYPIDDEWFHYNHFGSHDDFVLSRGVDREHFESFDPMLDRLFCRVELYEERPGIREVLQFVRQSGRPLHLASACREEVTRLKLLHHQGLIDYIDEIHGGERKRDTFLHVAKELNITPLQIGFVTDMARDIEEAHHAGVEKVVAITSAFCSREQLLPYGCPVVGDHCETLQCLKEWL